MVAAQTSAAEMLLSEEMRDESVVNLPATVVEACCVCVESELEADKIAAFTVCICPERLEDALVTLVSTPETAVSIEDVADSRLDAVARDPDVSEAPVRVRVPAAQTSAARVPNEVSVRAPAAQTALVMVLVEVT